MTSPIEVVVRCKNEMPQVERTLKALGACGVRILFIDSGSTDGSLDCAEAAGVEILKITPESYVPGRVLNDAMRRTRGAVVAFVNADAVPLEPDAVRKLVDLCTAGAAASFGRQIPRSAARPMTVADHARAFPDGPHDHKLDRFFSMAASAIRRDAWDALPFDERLRFSEDVDWTKRLRALGLTVTYASNALFEHSHDYDAAAMRRRMHGEGLADARIERRSSPRLWRDLVRPLAGATVRDARNGVLSLQSLHIRWSGERARYDGLREGARSPLAPVDTITRAGERFTARGDRNDESFIAAALAATSERIRTDVAPRARATVLLGSFGCGEGVVRSDGTSRWVHGDLDLVVVLGDAKQARRARAACAAISHSISRAQGMSIDVWPVSEDELDDPRGRLLWIDAGIRGARVLDGDPDLLRPLQRLGARAVAAEEIGRLLANRATGIALSRLAADAGNHDPVTAARHVAKAWLAAGDSLLLLVDHYERLPGERLKRLQCFAASGSPTARALVPGYEWAIATRKATDDPSLARDELAAESARLWRIHAAIEAHRLRVPALPTPYQYAELRARIYPDLPDVPPLGRLLGGARASLRRALSLRHAGRHPREIVARAAAVLAFGEDAARARGWVANALNAVSEQPRDVERALLAVRDVAA